MYEAKRKGGNGYKIYSSKMGEEDLDNFNINDSFQEYSIKITPN